LRDDSKQAREKNRQWETPDEYRSRADEILNRLGTQYEPAPKERKSNPLLDEATLAYMDGARKLETFKKWVRANFGDKLSDDQINDLFTAAAKDFQGQTASLNEIKGRIGEEVARTIWENSSAAQKRLAYLASVASLYKVLALTADVGILGTQFGAAGLSRPGVFAYAKAPRSMESPFAQKWIRFFSGGYPGGKGNTVLQAGWKAFRSQQGLDEVMDDIRLIGDARHNNPDIYFQTYRDDPTNLREAPKHGFNLLSEDSGKTLFGETLSSLANAPTPLEMLKMMRATRRVAPLFEKFNRAADAMINTYKVVLFESLFEPFTHLQGVQRVQAGRAISTFVNTFTGMGRYDEKGRLERALRGMASFFTAPRFYVSSAEFTAPQALGGVVANVTAGAEARPLGQLGGAALGTIRPLMAARIPNIPNLPAKEQARVASIVVGEYVRIATSMKVVNAMLQSTNIGYVALDPEDPNYGSAIIKTSPNTQQVVPLIGQLGAWHRDFTQLFSGRIKDPLTQEYRPANPMAKIGTLVVNKMAPPFQFIPSLMFPSKATKQPEGGLQETQYTLPGGERITLSDPINYAYSAAKYVLPGPILMKIMLTDGRLLWENRDRRDFPSVFGAMVGSQMMNFGGVGARVQLNPAALADLNTDKQFKDASVEERRQTRGAVMFGPKVQR
jgi:hypothetical protein